MSWFGWLVKPALQVTMLDKITMIFELGVFIILIAFLCVIFIKE